MEVEDLKNKNIALASVGRDNCPHNIAVEINDIRDNKIIITNNFMNTTIENIKSNPNVSLVFWENDEGIEIDGIVEYFDSGKWFDFVKELPENEEFDVKGAIVIEIKNIKKI